MNHSSLFQRIVWRIRKNTYVRYTPLTFSEKRVLCESIKEMVVRHLPRNNWKYSNYEYSQKTNKAENVFYIGISDRQLELCIQIAMGIRFAEVESIWQSAQNLENNLGHWTVMGVIENYIRGVAINYRIDNLKDIDYIEPEIRELIDKASMPFWKQYGTISMVDQEWNIRPFDFNIDGIDVLHHATRSIIIAKLVKNPNYYGLVNMRRQEIINKLNMDLRKNGLEKYDILVSFLNKGESPNKTV